jgi:hypothetical protein
MPHGRHGRRTRRRSDPRLCRTCHIAKRRQSSPNIAREQGNSPRQGLLIHPHHAGLGVHVVETSTCATRPQLERFLSAIIISTELILLPQRCHLRQTYPFSAFYCDGYRLQLPPALYHPAC